MNRQVAEKPRLALMAGLQDVAVRDLTARIGADPKLALGGEGQELIQIQQERLRYSELAGQLETYWKALAANHQRDHPAAAAGVIVAALLLPLAPAGVPVVAALAGVVPGLLVARGVRA